MEGEIRLMISQMDVALFQLMYQNFLHSKSKSEFSTWKKYVSWLIVSLMKDPPYDVCHKARYALKTQI